MPFDFAGGSSARGAPHLAPHLQPKVVPRAVGRSRFERAASGSVYGFVGEPTPRIINNNPTPRSEHGRDQLRDPESARRRAAGVLRRAPSCDDPKTDGWGSAAEGLSNGRLEKLPLYANPR